ncbi:hypothetical protein BH10BAC6_BH10BAC6_01180 [soil metagenome]
MNQFKSLSIACCATILIMGLQVPLRAQQQVWRKIQPMSTARFFSKAAPISDHEVLVIGGYTPVTGSTTSCEVIDVVAYAYEQVHVV